MKKSSEEIRRKIIGLGDSSVKKSYYPLLQQKIRELEKKQTELVEIVRNLEEREVALEKMLDEKTALLSEVNHRVKNNLQIVTSLLNLGDGDTAVTDSQKFMTAKNRIEILSLVYQEFLFSDNYSEVTFCTFLKALTREIKSDIGAFETDVLFDFPDYEVIIHLDIALPLALVAYETIYSALKYSKSSSISRPVISLSYIEDDLNPFGCKLSVFPLRKDTELQDDPLVGGLIDQISGKYGIDKSDSGILFTIYFDSYLKK